MGIVSIIKAPLRKIKQIGISFNKKFVLPKKVKRYFKKHPELKRNLASYKNLHKGERCFIIGNGPSLRAEDLTKIKNEVCFASNFIGKIFDKTEWRPTYFAVMDPGYIKNYLDEFLQYEKKEMFVAVYADSFNSAKRYFSNEKITFCHLTHGIKGIPKFSNDAYNLMYGGHSVTYCLLQLAVYMGFKEIYLLGVDNNYSTNMSFKKVIGQGSKNDHFYSNGDKQTRANVGGMTNAFIAAKDFADKNNIKIYNATRGGKLEVFERVNFDEIKTK